MKHNIGHTAARRNAPKQPRAIRAGPHEGGKKNWASIPGIYSNFPHTKKLLDSFGFFHIPRVYLIFPNTGGLSDFAQKSGGLCGDIFS